MSEPVPSRSPWIAQLTEDGPSQPLDDDIGVDVAVIGAGIAGAATAFFLLRETDRSVLLVERGRMGRGASGHNAGQLTTYFERPLSDLVDAYGFDLAIDGQRALDGAWDLLEAMVAECGATVRIDRFAGRMGMYSLNHVLVHLATSALRRRGGLFVPDCFVADDAPFLAEIPVELAGLYRVVPAATVRDLLGPSEERYCAVLCDRKGCSNSALLVEQVVRDLEVRYRNRFRFVDGTPVARVALGRDAAVVGAGSHRVDAALVVMCTNGFQEHVIVNLVGHDIGAPVRHRISARLGYMAAFTDAVPAEANASSYIRNPEIGGSTPYVYVTRRSFDAGRGRTGLTCIGGPETPLDDVAAYRAEADVPGSVIDEIDELLPIAQPARSAGLPYDYAWHGVMGYTESYVRLIGFEPRNPVLLYNLGCNGVGFLPSIYGGWRIARLVRGDDLGPSIFDPP